MRGVKRAVTPKVKNNVLWLDFNYKPQWQDRQMLKSVGFRWSPSKAMWYAKNTTEARRVANKFNLTEFIAKPIPTEDDFTAWEKTLSRTDWHTLVTEANDIYDAMEEHGEDIAVQVMDEYLHRKFNMQWV